MKVIGVVGEIGSGKDEVLKYLRDRYGVPYLSTGDIVRKMAGEQGVEGTRENLEAISRRCFQDMGKGCFVRMAGEEIIRQGWNVAGISGVRTPDDVELLRKTFGKDFILVRVDIADPLVRYDRLRKRNEERDPLTYEAFQAQDREEEETFNISKAVAMADCTVDNSGPLGGLHAEIDAMVASGCLPVK
ncbi:MAG: AAA family ATPase [Chloroflexi bacterium]|nr:AAA family ATPase [Chloroflexota bacterium]